MSRMKTPDEWMARYNELFAEEVTKVSRLGFAATEQGFDKFWAMFIREVQEDAAADERNRTAMTRPPNAGPEL